MKLYLVHKKVQSEVCYVVEAESEDDVLQTLEEDEYDGREVLLWKHIGGKEVHLISPATVSLIERYCEGEDGVYYGGTVEDAKIRSLELNPEENEIEVKKLAAEHNPIDFCAE